MTCPRIALLATGLLCLLLSSMPLRSAAAQPVQVRVEKGISEYQDLEFAAAIATLEAVLSLGDASQSQKLVALELIAISHLTLGHGAESRSAFVRLLKLSPGYVLRYHDGSPKVEAVFESVRAGMPKKPETDEGGKPETDPGPTKLRLKPSKSARAGRRFEVVIEHKGPDPSELVFFWRANASSTYASLPLRRSRSMWRAKLSLPDRQSAYVLEYYALAKGVAGQDIAAIGDAQHPLEIEVSGGGTEGGGAARTTAWYSRWPIWAGVGLAVTGGSILVLSSGSDPQKGALSPGRITLTP